MIIESYIICYFTVTFLYCLYTLKIKKLLAIFHKNIKFTKQDFLGLQHININNEEYRFKKGKYYAYNPLSKIILYIDKDEYSLYDIFGLYHEIGHYLDDLKDDKVLINMRLTAINRIFFVPFYLVCTFIALFGSRLFNWLHIVTFILTILFFIHRIYFICKYETSASDYAIEQLKCKYEYNDINLLKKLAKTTMKSQLFFSGFGIMSIIFIRIMYNILSY